MIPPRECSLVSIVVNKRGDAPSEEDINAFAEKLQAEAKKRQIDDEVRYVVTSVGLLVDTRQVVRPRISFILKTFRDISAEMLDEINLSSEIGYFEQLEQIKQHHYFEKPGVIRSSGLNIPHHLFAQLGRGKYNAKRVEGLFSADERFGYIPIYRCPGVIDLSVDELHRRIRNGEVPAVRYNATRMCFEDANPPTHISLENMTELAHTLLEERGLDSPDLMGRT